MVFFHYDITEKSVFKKRYNDIMNREYERGELANCIESYMEQFPRSEKINESLEKLRDPSSAVVIGGQQAGLLTGPLYTIHKVLSIIKLAEQQEEYLGKPVVPVFWVAGEDHDFLEVNHIFTETDAGMKKISFSGIHNDKRMVSHIDYDKSQMIDWVNRVFEQFGERKHTKEMLSLLHNAIYTFDTFTEFFSYLITYLFKDYGLLVIDSANEELRNLEKPAFSMLIERNEEIAESLLAQQENILSNGFNKTIEIDPNCANLFYYINDERVLLEFDRNNNLFFSEKANVKFTREELYDLLHQYPEKFSNNVVTRPVMQESLFPTLAFIAGPGEIAYWGELKQVFERLEMKMPPIIPRLNITLVETAVERDANELSLSLKKVIEEGLEFEKDTFIESVADKQLSDILNNAADYLNVQYEEVFQRLAKIDASLTPLVEKNLSIHIKQFEFLQHKVDLSIKNKHEAVINKYNRIEHHLCPDGSFQERVWNIFYFLNDRGEEFIHSLLKQDYAFDGKHKLIKV